MKKFVLFFFSVGFLFQVKAQQRMSLSDCEASFVNNNLQLLANQYNISMAEAEIIQSKIWELPEFTFQTNLFNPEGKTWFEVGKYKEAQLTQLIYLGGKKKNEIEFAKSNKELAQLQFNQLLVELKSQLRETYYNLYYELLKSKNIDDQLFYMNDLLKAYKVQTNKGNISLKDYVRLQTMVIQLNNDKIELNNNILAYQQTLKLLTNASGNIIPDLSTTEADEIIKIQPFGDASVLKEKALENNADYLYNKKLIDNSKLFTAWQKSLNVPDLNLGVGWDQSSGVYKNEFNVSVGIPIPLWKVNKGNLEKANYAVKQNELNANFQKINLESKVEVAYQTWKNLYNQYEMLTPIDLQNIDLVYNGILTNFRKGNVSLIEFTDFMESYRDTTLQILEMKKQIMISVEELNQLVQTQIFY